MSPVRPLRAAIVAGLLVAAYVVALYTIRTVPLSVISMLGGPSRHFDRVGGLLVHYRPAPGTEDEVKRFLGARADVRYENGLLILEFPGVDGEAARELVDMLQGGLQMKEALDDLEHAKQIGESEEIKLDIDQWRPDVGGELHTTAYLVSQSLEALRAAVEAWTPPEGTEIAYERIEPHPGAKDQRPFWRTYLLASEVLIDGTMIANAVGSYDQYSHRPIVLLDFTREGAERFCDITRRIAGRKLATLLGGRIRSAPIINEAICNGRASITMGGSDPQTQQQERDALVAVLSNGALPPGGTVEERVVMEGARIENLEWLGRFVLGILAGLGFGLVTWIVVRIARPVRRERAPKVDGPFPVRRLFVLALAPVALIGLSYITIPLINEVELEHAMQGKLGDHYSVIALGVGPVLLAFVLVEIAALFVTRLRWRRFDPVGRVRLGQAVAALAMLLALIQGYFVAKNYESMGQYFGSDTINLIAADPGWKFRILVMVSLAAGTTLLAVIAGMIREHGLGNGYAMLLATSIVIDALRPFWWFGPEWFSYPGAKLGYVTAAGIAIATVYVLRWRVETLRVPTSGIAPLSDSGGLLFVIIAISALGLGNTLIEVIAWVSELRTSTKLVLAVVVLSIPLWAWLFARPSVIDEAATRAGVEPPTLKTWLRALAITVLFIAATGIASMFALLTDQQTFSISNALHVVLVTAVVLDIVADARARRRALVPAAVVHQVQHLAILERVLTDAGIPYHLHASNVRTLYAFFGPWAPIEVLVPAEHADAARKKLDTRLSVFD